MSENALLIVLALVVLGILVTPLLRGARRRDGTTTGVVMGAEPESEHPAAIGLREIEMDRAMGRLSETDYRVLRSRYEARLAAVVSEQGSEAAQSSRPATPPRSDLGARGEKAQPTTQQPQHDITSRGATAAATPEERAELLVRQHRATTVECSVCGLRPESDARFCSNCGRFLVPCPGCGTRIEELGARYCPNCGAAIYKVAS
jgi:hypothetical protein